MLVVTVTKAQM